MTERAVYSVVCLSGHGIASEVMAQASRALASVSRLHGFRVRETHPPFGSGALTQSGNALPTATRHATLGAQAILCAAASDPALAGVESELDLRARMDRVAFGGRGAITLFSPLLDSTLEWTLARAFDVARSSRARIASVGGNAAWVSAFVIERGRWARTTSANSRVVAPIPTETRSGVRTPFAHASSTAPVKVSAARRSPSPSPSMSAAASSIEAGLATPWPAMSSAAP